MAAPGSAQPTNADVARQLATYFALLDGAWRAAADRAGTTDVTLSLAGRAVRLQVAGELATAAVLPPLAHAIRASEGAADFEVLVWEEASSAVPLPPPPWAWPSPESPVRLVLPAGGEGYRIWRRPDGGSFMMLSLADRRAVVWFADMANLPWYERAKPLMQVWQWWLAAGGARIVHAGCIGSDAGAALLVGRCGSGKSSTAVLGALAGLEFVSDDYCLLTAEPAPVAHAMYSTAKLNPDHLARFPELPPAAVSRPEESDEKSILWMEQIIAPARMAARLPVRSVIAPRVTGVDRPRLEPLSPAQALLALAPSTLLQLYADAGTGCGDLADVVRRLPCWRLELGGGLEAVSDLLRQHLEKA